MGEEKVHLQGGRRENLVKSLPRKFGSMRAAQGRQDKTVPLPFVDSILQASGCKRQKHS